MYAFEFEMPTKIVFGEGEVSRVGEQAAAFGKKAMLVTYDEDFVKQVGFYDKVKKSCDAAGIELLEFFGVKSNPTAEHAAAGIKMAKEQKPDVLIALGGGSAMDEAKFIGVAARYDGDPWDFPTGKAEIKDCLLYTSKTAQRLDMHLADKTCSHNTNPEYFSHNKRPFFVRVSCNAQEALCISIIGLR